MSIYFGHEPIDELLQELGELGSVLADQSCFSFQLPFSCSEGLALALLALSLTFALAADCFCLLLHVGCNFAERSLHFQRNDGGGVSKCSEMA